MRIALGVLLFAGLVVFAGPTPLAFCISLSDGSGDPAGLFRFGLTAALIFGVPGALAFPYERRLQALGWLALACLGYFMMIVVMLALGRYFPLSPENSAFMSKTRLHYDRIAATALVLLATWFLLFRRKRMDTRP
jgi:hypothetical protein